MQHLHLLIKSEPALQQLVQLQILDELSVVINVVLRVQLPAELAHHVVESFFSHIIVFKPHNLVQLRISREPIVIGVRRFGCDDLVEEVIHSFTESWRLRLACCHQQFGR